MAQLFETHVQLAHDRAGLTAQGQTNRAPGPVDVDGPKVYRAMHIPDAIGADLAVLRKGVVQPARCHVQKRIRHVTAVLPVDGPDMPVARQEHDPAGPSLADKIVKTLAFAREVAPALPAMSVRNHLNGRNDEAQFRRLS